MTEPDRLSLAPDRLGSALARLNAARREPTGSPARLAELLEALAATLEAGGDGGADALARLEAMLGEAGAEASAARLRAYLEPVLARLAEALLGHPERRLAAYGTLRPGERNHHHVADLTGRWTPGTVEGSLREWGAAPPGFERRVPGDQVAVRVLESLDLPGAWARLDAFEGACYRRILVPVAMAGGVAACNIYELT